MPTGVKPLKGMSKRNVGNTLGSLAMVMKFGYQQPQRYDDLSQKWWETPLETHFVICLA